MATFKVGSLTMDTYLEWIDIMQGHATDIGRWQYIDPEFTYPHNEPKNQSHVTINHQRQNLAI